MQNPQCLLCLVFKFFPSGSCPQQLDREDHREERSNDQENHGGHGQQDHGQLHQRHLLLQPRACDHHQGSDSRHFKSRGRGNRKPSSVFILVKTFSSSSCWLKGFFKITGRLRNRPAGPEITKLAQTMINLSTAGHGAPVCDVPWPPPRRHDGHGRYQWTSQSPPTPSPSG